jgi:hypothetical protein
MSALRIALVVIAAALAGTLAWMTNWGQDIGGTDTNEGRKIVAKADATSVLPDFKLGAESNAYAQIAERPLLNPTRKPAPTQAVVAVAPEPPKPQIRRGLYQLIGVADYGNVKVAQVKEVASNKVKSVRVGDELQELRVASLDDAKLTLTFAGESETLEIAKFTASGRVPQPAPQPVAPPPQTAQAPAFQDSARQRPPASPAPMPPPVAATPPAEDASLPPGAVRNVRTGAIVQPSAPRQVVNSSDPSLSSRRRLGREPNGQ